MEIIKLNLIPTGSLPVVHTSQYDEGRVFRIELFEGSAVYTLDGSEVLECDVKKPDGNIVTIAVVNTSDNYVDVETTLQMNACAGESFGELHIKKGAQEIGTLNFILAVERSPLENGIQSDSGIHNLQTQIGDAVADQYAAEDVVFDATPTAGHGVGFAVTSEGVKNANDAIIASIPEELDDLQDVTTSSPTSGEALVWDGSKWTNGTVSTVGSIDDLNDVDTTGKGEADSLRYDSTAQEWKAQKTKVFCTQAEYDALELGGNLAPQTDYIITDGVALEYTANDLSYDGGAATTHDEVEKAHSFKQLYSKSTYQNDIGETITLSETSANFRFLRISVYINDMGYSNAGMLLLANIKGGIQIQHFPLCINANLGSVRLDLSGTSLKLYSTSFGSTMFIYQVVGIY